jgi:hypothetical protein
MSTVKSKKLQVGTDASASNNFTIYQPATPDGTLRVGVGNADSPTEVGRFDSNGITMASGKAVDVATALSTATGSAPSYSARAWVNFNGVGTVAIRDSGNVSSITDLAVGRYEVNFTNAFADVNYVCVTGLNLNTSSGGSLNYNRMAVSNPATTSKAYYNTFSTNAVLVDVYVNQLAVFR